MLNNTNDPENRTVLVMDYDGTLHDTTAIYEPAFRTTMKKLEKQGLVAEREYSSEEIKGWIGFNAIDMWNSFHPEFTPEQKAAASASVGEIMTSLIDQGKTSLYPGAEAVLEELSRNFELWFLSNCKVSYKEAHRRLFGLDRWFSRYLCTETYGFIPKEEIFKQAADPERNYIAVGDRAQDMNLALNSGIPFIGCAYGFGTEGELSAADLIIDNIKLLPEAALGIAGRSPNFKF